MARILFLVGIVVALLVSLWARGGMFPWILGAFGIVVGILFWWERAPGWILVALIALIVALSAILQQPLNPEWLSHLVFFVRLFIAHVALAAGLLAIAVSRPVEP
jgi:hypothetical protein